MKRKERGESERTRGEKVQLPAAAALSLRNETLFLAQSIYLLTISFFTIPHGGAGPRCSRGKRGDKREAGEDERGLPRWNGGDGSIGDGRLVMDLATVSIVGELCRRRRPLLLFVEHAVRPEVEVTEKEEDMVAGERERRRSLSFLFRHL